MNTCTPARQCELYSSQLDFLPRFLQYIMVNHYWNGFTMGWNQLLFLCQIFVKHVCLFVSRVGSNNCLTNQIRLSASFPTIHHGQSLLKWIHNGLKSIMKEHYYFYAKYLSYHNIDNVAYNFLIMSWKCRYFVTKLFWPTVRKN